MKTNNVMTSYDDKWFNDNYSHLGITSRWEWFINDKPKVVSKKRLFEEMGATYLPNNINLGENIAPNKNKKGSTDQETEGNEDAVYTKKSHKIQNIKYEDTSKFNYKEMLKCDRDIKRKHLLHLSWTHDFYDNLHNIIYEEIAEQYEDDVNSGDIYKHLEIYQQLSTYVKQQRFNHKDAHIDGSILINVALMCSSYVKTGNKIYDINKLNKIIEENTIDFYDLYSIFIIYRCFTHRLHYADLYNDKYLIRKKWLQGLIQNRETDKDLKSVNKLFIIKKDNNKDKKITLFDLVIRY